MIFISFERESICNVELHYDNQENSGEGLILERLRLLSYFAEVHGQIHELGVHASPGQTHVARPQPEHKALFCTHEA